MSLPILVVLDRDGVINHDSDEYIKSLREWRPIEDSIEAMARLYQAGIQLAVATNQSGLGRGFFDNRNLDLMHGQLIQALAEHDARLRELVFCPHLPEHNCECRKPRSGMLQALLADLQLHSGQCVYVGDTLKDCRAAQSLAMPFVHVLSGKGQREWDSQADLWPLVPRYANLSEWVRSLAI